MNENQNQNPDIDQLIQTIKTITVEHPNYYNTVMTDLHSIINKFDPDIVSGKRDPFPLTELAFKPKVKSVRERVYATVGQKIKIPDLRFEADRIAQELAIPLPNSTRKNNEALMEWFDSNWATVEPKLKEYKNKSEAS